MSADEGRKTLGSKATVGDRQTPMSNASRLENSPKGQKGSEATVRADDTKDGKPEDAQDQEPNQEQNPDEDIVEEDDPALLDPNITVDGIDMTSGAKLTFTFNEGLVV